MNNNESPYNKFSLVSEMLETGEVVKNIDISVIEKVAEQLKFKNNLLSGEGSSRIFPAKKSIVDSMKLSYDGAYHTEAATQSLDYDLSNSNVFVASNSGKTKEGVRLIRSLKEKGHQSVIGVIANDNTPIQTEADAHYLLTCGKEEAVAATKSVVEQALFYDILFRKLNNKALPDLNKLGDLITEVLESKVPESMITSLASSPILYWAGENNGVAEELTLKTNEITRKSSDFLEGTYAVHGIEEVMNPNESVVLVNPFPMEEEKFEEVLCKGVGMNVFSITSKESRFPTFKIPEYGEFTQYLELVAGWNVMVEIGLRLNVEMDKPERARKVGNEFAI